jgi:hypothetical protein
LLRAAVWILSSLHELRRDAVHEVLGVELGPEALVEGVDDGRQPLDGVANLAGSAARRGST